MVFGRDALLGARDASQSLNESIFQHADAVQHLAEALEEEVSACTQEFAQRLTLLHEASERLSSAGVAIARAGERISTAGEHIALGIQQTVVVIAASMLTVVTGLFGWRYLVLGCACLWLSGFELARRQPAEPQSPHGRSYAGPDDQTGVPFSGGKRWQQDDHPRWHGAPAPGSSKRVSFEQGPTEDIADGSQAAHEAAQVLSQPLSPQQQQPPAKQFRGELARAGSADSNQTGRLRVVDPLPPTTASAGGRSGSGIDGVFVSVDAPPSPPPHLVAAGATSGLVAASDEVAAAAQLAARIWVQQAGREGGAEAAPGGAAVS